MLKDYASRSIMTAVALVNSYDVATGDDLLRDRDSTAALLCDLQWENTDDVRDVDHTRLARWRHQLRSVFETQDANKAVSILNFSLEETGAVPRLTNHDGVWHWHYTRPGAPLRDRVISTTAVALLSAIADGALPRMRVCQGDGCHRVFVDLSRPGTRRFCEPSGCANRAHVRAFRTRARQEPLDIGN
jgi:CGNR zinc finger/Putative stress-induced transcription regulator